MDAFFYESAWPPSMNPFHGPNPQTPSQHFMSPPMNFDIFIGLDQTGATNAKGQPKPLPMAILQPRKLLVFASIKNLTLSDLTETFESQKISVKNKKILICVDSALGLPAPVTPPFRELIARAASFDFKNKPYGALTAHAFFNSFLDNKTLRAESRTKKEKPARHVEVLVQANSVFNLQPFQKNIGCGTFRVLKNLAQDQSWYSVWPFEPITKQYAIAEGYPSYFWKTIFKMKTRNLEHIKKLTKIAFKNQDQADSYILALGAQSFRKQLFTKTPPIARQEGWILGVPWNTSTAGASVLENGGLRDSRA